MTDVEKYKEGLTQYLVEVCTGNGLLKGTLLSTPDIDEAWVRLAPSFYGDAVREFNHYPEFCLGCAGYLGMAVAFLWDADWTRYAEVPYAFFLGERGFDDMDDHITDEILRDRRHSVPAMQTTAVSAIRLTSGGRSTGWCSRCFSARTSCSISFTNSEYEKGI